MTHTQEQNPRLKPNLHCDLYPRTKQEQKIETKNQT